MSKTRPATPTVAFIDEYCARERDLFHTVRRFEQFTALQLGFWAETRRTTLPQLGQSVHMDPQARHHVLATAECSVEALRQRRLELLQQAGGPTPFILCLDETGDRKKGRTTDDVRRHRQPVQWQPADAGQGDRLGPCRWRARRHDLPAALASLHTPDQPQSGCCRHDQAATGHRAQRDQRGGAALGLSLQCRLG
jgi:hypothetical protein